MALTLSEDSPLYENLLHQVVYIEWIVNCIRIAEDEKIMLCYTNCLDKVVMNIVSPIKIGAFQKHSKE